MSNNCPLCNQLGNIYYQKNNRLFYKCNTCYGIYLDKDLRPNKNAEKLRYETHNNDVHDKRYQKFVSPITSAILKNFTPNNIGLDFGAGTGPVISKVLKDNNFSIKQYDPFFHNYPKLLENKYDYIACCEVIEHFYSPKKEFKLLKKLLHPNGVLYCMTDIYKDNIDFHTWYYKNDPTHVFIYHENTIEWIKEKFNFSDVIITDRLTTYFN